eukprot:TRINITY_DN9277_c1_g2_i5.p1 TRINITY_DN9277_c1_g2~~TRINITY_DN9277_c1_g2_i5.p1  ORF type:complete len:202 (-),score=38.09 TRINITY_DN9277_c1_g2_i5:1864-2469(-)
MEEPCIERLEMEISSLVASQDRMFKEMMEMFAAMNTRFDLLSASQTLDTGENSHNHHKNIGGRPGMSQPKLVKLDFPRFNGGEDPTSWICCADQFFEFHQTPEGERVPLASFHLEGDAQLWYQILKEEWQPITRDMFKEGLHVRFGRTQFDDFFGDLTKLKQIGTVGVPMSVWKVAISCREVDAGTPSRPLCQWPSRKLAS